MYTTQLYSSEPKLHLKVNSVKYIKLRKIITFNNGEKLNLPISASITDKNKVIQINDIFFVICKNGLAKICPSYNESENILLGNRTLFFNIKEVENKEEEDSQKQLSKFHYRGAQTFGRRTKLIIKTEHQGRSLVIGYIELSIASLSNKARNTVMNSAYNDGKVKWRKWDFSTKGKYSKLIVNISRIVIHPDFRGIGLSQLLLKHAIIFTQNYWQTSCMKPLFLEITADMLKFVPFVSKLGMTYIGDTKGNISRIKNDITYMIKHKDKYTKHSSSAMVRMQSHYLKHFIKTCKENKISQYKLLQEISILDKDSIRSKYPLIYGILRFPKPTFMLGLIEYSDNFIRNRSHELKINPIERFHEIGCETINSPIVLNSISLEFKSKFKETKKTIAIQEAFGIHRENVKCDVIRDLNIEIKCGDIVLICGPSGSGKTSLLNIINGVLKPSNGTIIRPKNMRIGLLKKLSSKKPLIEIIGKTIEESIYVLNIAGLSEPRLYLKTFDQLSTGQKYRAMIAALIASRSNVWIADEFLTSLNNITANIVVANIKKLVKRLGITLIVASSNPENYVATLNPDKIIIKHTGSSHFVSERTDGYPKFFSETIS